MEGSFQVVLVSEKSQHHFAERNVFITIDLLCVVIGNKGTMHTSYFQLEGILQEGSSDEIKVLAFKRLEVSTKGVDGVVLVELPVLDVITNGTDCTSLDFKDEGITLLVDVPTIDLRTQQ